MKTEVVMERPLFEGVVRQKSKTEFLSATDLVKVGNNWRYGAGLPFFNFSAWLRSKSTKEFITELETHFDNVIQKSTKKGVHTWVHPFLFIDLALAINPKFKVQVYQWLYDHLLQYRNDSGDSYKKMCGALYLASRNKQTFPAFIKSTAKKIQVSLKVSDWQKANEATLQIRNKIHENIALLADVLSNPEQAVILGIEKTLKDSK